LSDSQGGRFGGAFILVEASMADDDDQSTTVLLPSWERLAPSAMVDRQWKRYLAHNDEQWLRAFERVDLDGLIKVRRRLA
jgi:hypothetical protein